MQEQHSVEASGHTEFFDAVTTLTDDSTVACIKQPELVSGADCVQQAALPILSATSSPSTVAQSCVSASVHEPKLLSPTSGLEQASAPGAAVDTSQHNALSLSKRCQDIFTSLSASTLGFIKSVVAFSMLSLAEGLGLIGMTIVFGILGTYKVSLLASSKVSSKQWHQNSQVCSAVCDGSYGVHACLHRCTAVYLPSIL